MSTEPDRRPRAFHRPPGMVGGFGGFPDDQPAREALMAAWFTVEESVDRTLVGVSEDDR